MHRHAVSHASPFAYAHALVAAVVLILSFALPAAARSPLPSPPKAAAQQSATQPDTAASNAEALIKVLRDDRAREALIKQLEQIAAKGAAGSKGAAAPTASAAAPGTQSGPGPSVIRRIAEATQSAAQATATAIQGFWNQLSHAPDTFSALGQADLSKLSDSLKNLALTIAASYAVFLVLRSLARRLWGAMGRAAARAGFWRTLILAIASTGIDALVVVAAWAAGYAIAVTAFGEFGSIAILQTLYLNAFLAVQLAKVVLRALIAPGAAELRLLPLRDGAVRFLDRWLVRLIALLGYGQVLVVPVATQQVSWSAGRAVGAVIGLIALAVLAGMVLAKRRPVADWLSGNGGRRAGTLGLLARHWHWPALIYLAGLALIVLARPGNMLFPVLGASGQILLAVIVGYIAATWLRRAIARGVSLPDAVNKRLPLLERRLNAFVPKVLLAFHVLVVAAVILFALDTVGLIDAGGWLGSRLGAQFSGQVIGVALILVLGFLVWLAMGSWVDWRLNPDYGRPPTSREQTLLTLLRNAATIAVLVITLMFAMSEAGLNIGPLLASAGVLGLAIGFGAQKLVQDIITGVFIQFENAINVGDVVTAGGTTGVVERLTIRSVSLRDLNGTYHIIPFSSVDMVSNFMRGFAYYVCDMGVAYRENVDEVKQAMHDAYDELRADPDQAPLLMGDLEWFGLNSFGDSAVMVRARIKTLPGKQWGVGRAYNGVLKRVFDERGIEIPFPHQTIYFGEDKQGNAPPMHVAMQGRPAPAPVADETGRIAETAEASPGKPVDDAPPASPEDR